MLRYLMSVIVLTLVFGLITTPAVRAQDGTPSATPGVTAPTTERLLDTTTDALPTGHAIVAVDRWRLQSGSPALTGPPLGGVLMVTVESGALTVTSGGTDHPLAAGEMFALADEEVAFRVSGPEDATMFLVYIFSGFADTGFWTADVLTHTVDYLISTSADALPGGSARLVLERLTLPPGSALPPQDVTPLVWTEIGEGAVGMTLEGEQLPFRWKSGAERTFRHGQYLPVLQPGTRMTLRNAEDGPLVLYRLTIAPIGSSTPTAGTVSASTSGCFRWPGCQGTGFIIPRVSLPRLDRMGM